MSAGSAPATAKVTVSDSAWALACRRAAALRPLVYACPGCSRAAQLASQVAVRLDRSGVAEMPCIAGVGSGVPRLVKTARSGRPTLALDGCALACVRSTLARPGIAPTRHHPLQQYGVTKRPHEDFGPAQARKVLERVVQELQNMPLEIEP